MEKVKGLIGGVMQVEVEFREVVRALSMRGLEMKHEE